MRVLIVDDEPLARSHLARLCRKQQDLSVIAEADSGAHAIEALEEHDPDLVLLDIQLNDMSGFDVLRARDARKAVHAIMVTAHAEYAVQAFEADAIDYITKPVTTRRFQAAIDRARRRIADTGTEKSGNGSQAPIRYLVGERMHRLYFIEIEDIDFISAEGNYVKIHSARESYISRSTLKLLEARLRTAGFVRIQKSLLVNLRGVEYAERIGPGIFALTLRSGPRLVSGPSYRRAIVNEMRRIQSPAWRGPRS